MATRIVCAGNTLTVAIPEELAAQAGLAAGDPVEWIPNGNGSLTLVNPARTASKKKPADMTLEAVSYTHLIKLLRDAVSAADFFFVSELAPYDPAELIPVKKGESTGDAALALRVLQTAQQVLACLLYTSRCV